MTPDPGMTAGYTHTANGRTFKLFGCARKGCDRISLDFESFKARDGKGYCLNHIPWRSRLRLWWQQWRVG